MDSAHADVIAALDAYFEGFHEGDIEKLRTIFHPNCHLYQAMSGELVDSDMETVYARVGTREKPAARGDDPVYGVLTVDQSGPECAFAKVHIALGDKHFTDYLTLLKIDGGWRIITKTFSGVDRPDVAPLKMG